MLCAQPEFHVYGIGILTNAAPRNLPSNHKSGRSTLQQKGSRKNRKRHRSGWGMTPLWLLCVLAVVAAALSFFVMEIWLRAGYVPLAVPFIAFAMPILVGMFVLWQGWNVHRYQHGKRSMSALAAARIVVLAQAASRTGAILVGVVFGLIAAYKHSGATAFLDTQVTHLWLAGLGSFILIVAAYIAEWWCIISDDDDDAGDLGSRGGSAAPA